MPTTRSKNQQESSSNTTNKEETANNVSTNSSNSSLINLSLSASSSSSSSSSSPEIIQVKLAEVRLSRLPIFQQQQQQQTNIKNFSINLQKTNEETNSEMKAPTASSESRSLRKSGKLTTSGATSVSAKLKTKTSRSASRSNSRSPSRGKLTTRSSTGLKGAKVSTKKELEKKNVIESIKPLDEVKTEITETKSSYVYSEVGRRNLRSNSSNSSTGTGVGSRAESKLSTDTNLSSFTPSSVNQATIESLRRELLDDYIQQKSRSKEATPRIDSEFRLLESASDPHDVASRYELRKRNSPFTYVSSTSSTSESSKSKISTLITKELNNLENESDSSNESSNKVNQNLNRQTPIRGSSLNKETQLLNEPNNKSKPKEYESGYLKFTCKQILKLILASLLLVILLVLINHFHLAESNTLLDRLNNYKQISYEYLNNSVVILNEKIKTIESAVVDYVSSFKTK